MTNAELIAALRECANWIEAVAASSQYAHDELMALHYCDKLRDAADALEADERLLDQNTKRCEALRKQLRESHENYEKHLNELEAQLPKEGEWITTRTENHDGEIYCSVCDHDAPTEGDYRQVKTDYCQNCGARMDGLRKDNETKLKGE